MVLEGICIRPVSLSDRETLASWGADPRLRDWHQDADPWQEAMQMSRAQFNFIVEERGAEIGSVSVEGDWSIGTSAELGIMIVPERQGGGRGMLAVALALNFAFTKTAVHRIWHGVIGSNYPVMRFFRKAGFIEEGRAREARKIDGSWVDEVYFSVLEQEWRNGAVAAAKVIARSA
jgi:RimJ/RimL family protein N-acetyltransferase